MLKFRSIRSKLSFITGLGIFVTVTILITYTAISARNVAIKNAQDNVEAQATEYTYFMKNRVELALTNSRTMAYMLTTVHDEKNPIALSRESLLQITRDILERYDELLGAWTYWAPNAFDGKDSLYHNKLFSNAEGRTYTYHAKDMRGVIKPQPCYPSAENDTSEWYVAPIKAGMEYITAPLKYPINGVDVLMMTAETPIYKNEEFLGLAGCEISIDWLQQTAVESTKKTNIERIAVYSYSGTIAADTQNEDWLAENIASHYENSSGILRSIHKGHDEIVVKDGYMNIIKPVQFGNVPHKWQIRMSVPMSAITAQANVMMWTQIFMGLTLTFLMIVAMYFVLSEILQPVSKLSNLSKKIASGHLGLKIQIENEDEIGTLAQSFNIMSEKLREIVSNIRTNSEGIAAGSSQISSSSQIIAEGANEQAASTEEVTASLEESLATIIQNAEHAQLAKEIAQQAERGILEGKKAASDSIEAMIQIAEKIEVINSISQKTEMLALNASIEAARAGQFGKGFSAVAAAVRKLSENTQRAAIEIDMLSARSLEVSRKSGDILDQIVPDVQKTSAIVQDISTASDEQKLSAQQMTFAIQQLNTVTQRNASTAEELASGSEELASQAKGLTELVSYFVLDEKDKTNKMADLKARMRDIMDMMEVYNDNNESEDKIIVVKAENNLDEDAFPDKKDKPKPSGISIDLEKERPVDDDFDQY